MGALTRFRNLDRWRGPTTRALGIAGVGVHIFQGIEQSFGGIPGRRKGGSWGCDEPGQIDADYATVPLGFPSSTEVTPRVSSHTRVDFLRSGATEEDLPWDIVRGGYKLNKKLTRLEKGLAAASDARREVPVARERERVVPRARLGSRGAIPMLGVRSRPSPTPTPTDGERECMRWSSYEAIVASMLRLPKCTWDDRDARLFRVLVGCGNHEPIEGVRRDGERGVESYKYKISDKCQIKYIQLALLRKRCSGGSRYPAGGMRGGLSVRMRLGRSLSGLFLLGRRLSCPPRSPSASVPDSHANGAATSAFTVLKKLDFERTSWGEACWGRSYGLRLCLDARFARVGSELIGWRGGWRGQGEAANRQKTRGVVVGVSFCSSLSQLVTCHLSLVTHNVT